MNRKWLLPMLAAVLVPLTLPACRGVTNPTRAVITGQVRYTNGQGVDRAKVTAESGETTFSDAAGRYRLSVRLPARHPLGSLTLSGRDGYARDRVYAVTHHGKAVVTLKVGTIEQDIVLNEAHSI